MRATSEKRVSRDLITMGAEDDRSRCSVLSVRTLWVFKVQGEWTCARRKEKEKEEMPVFGGLEVYLIVPTLITRTVLAWDGLFLLGCSFFSLSPCLPLRCAALGSPVNPRVSVTAPAHPPGT